MGNVEVVVEFFNSVGIFVQNEVGQRAVKSNITKEYISCMMIEMCKTHKLKKITVLDIARKCDINRGTFYYHFCDMQDLIIWTFRNSITDPAFDDVREQNPTWEMRMYAMINTIYKDRAFYSQVFASDAPYDLNKFVFNEIFDNYQARVKTYVNHMYGHLDNKAHIIHQMDSCISYFVYGTMGMIASWINSGMKTSADEIAYHLQTLDRIAFSRAIDAVVENTKTIEFKAPLCRTTRECVKWA